MNWKVAIAVLLTLSLWGTEKVGEDLMDWRLRLLGYAVALSWGWALT